MNEYLTPIQVGIALLQGILAQYKAAGAAADILAGVQSAIDELAKAHGTDVTQGGLESLRVPIPSWDKN